MSRLLSEGLNKNRFSLDDVILVNRSVYDSSTLQTTECGYQFPTSSPVIKQVVPPSLYDYQYAPDKLRFNVSSSMLRRSRPIIGNNDRLHMYIKKLHSQQCTVVLFLGGSVTDGHNVRGGEGQAYPRYFWFWLNHKYPCVNVDGSPGEHQVKKVRYLISRMTDDPCLYFFMNFLI